MIKKLVRLGKRCDSLSQSVAECHGYRWNVVRPNGVLLQFLLNCNSALIILIETK